LSSGFPSARANNSKANPTSAILPARSPASIDVIPSATPHHDHSFVNRLNAHTAISKRNAVTCSRIATPLEYHAKLVSAVRVVHQRMNSNAVKENCRTPTFVKGDVQSANNPCSILEGPVCNSDVRRNGQTSVVFQTLAEGRIERLSRWCTYPIRTSANDQCRSRMSFSKYHQVG
jgi:hypothetical protein